MDCAQTEMGRAAAQALQPEQDRAAVEREYRLVGEMMSVGEDPPLAPVHDIRPLLEGGNDGVLSPQELWQVSTTLEALAGVHTYLSKRRARLPQTSQEAAQVRGFDHLKADIERVVTEAGEVKDTATPELNRIRGRLRRTRREIVRTLEEIAASSPELFQDRGVSVRGGRFVLQLKSEAKARFDAVLHDTSDSGHTLFVEPLQMLSEQNELARLRSAEHDEVKRILAQLTSSIRAESAALNASLQGVTRLDMICARKRFAVRFDAVQPVISDRGVVQVINARHPLLSFKKHEVVPLNFVLPDDARVVLISGPNAGGKTVAMKTIGLFAAMMSAGLYLPAAEGTELPFFSRVHALIGDEQSLEGDLSSFSALLLRTGQILEQADGSSLVLLDEIGGSTAPDEGSALAIAVLEELQRRGAVVIATSHLGPLKAFVQDARGMANAAMEFKGRPTYRLIMGVPGESSALDIAAGLGFPGGVLQQARRYMNEDWLNLSERLKELTAERDRAALLRAELAQEKETVTRLRQDLEQKATGLRQFEQAERKRMKAEQEAMLRETRREIENLVRQIREQQASRETIKAAKQYVEEHLETTERPRVAGRKAQPVCPGPVKVEAAAPRAAAGALPAAGDRVHSRTFARQGTVAEIEGNEAVVAFGNIKMRLQLEDLEVLHHPEPEPMPVPVDSTEEFDPRLNLRGMTQEEAREAMIRFLDRAEMHGSRQVTIVHGKGTGALRTMIWERLRHDQRVGELRFGEQNEGGNGVTFVTLKG